ncbi:MAG: protein disulfide oxidoreductase [Sideroxyarcus sp.]|nr:protein disulfide oxidoreductase [Sideroxyarcus sp.]
MSGQIEPESRPQPRRAKWRVVLTNLLLIIVVVAAIRAWQQRDMVSGAAPELRGITLAGEFYDLPEHLRRPLLVHFWASWCGICRAEQGSIAAIAHDYQNVITVAMHSGKPEAVADFMHTQGIAFPVLNDEQGWISDRWGVHAVPASFIIDRAGQIRFIEVGYTTEIGLRLRLWWVDMF